MSELPKKTWLTPEQVADYYQLSRSGVYCMVSDGRLPASRVGDSKLIRIRRDDAERILRPID